MRICMGCMSEVRDDQDVCPYCGYKKDTPVKEAYYLLPETVLKNRYVVGKVLGYGGFGVTYIGWDAILKRIVAIKEYFPSDYATRGLGTKRLTIYSGDAYEQFQAGLSSFISEAKRQAQLHHVDGVVRIYDCIQENDTGYIIMEYLDGRTVKEILKDYTGGSAPGDPERFSYQEAEKIIISVLQTLSEVHKAGIIHRDIAPDNIFITKSNEVKLIDFGAARYAASAKSRSLSVILKPGYAPEEQYRSHGEQGPWTDVYGVGATFYRMVTGIKPDEAIERMVDDQLIPPSELGVQIPPEKERVLLKSLSVRKEGRYQTADAFLSALTVSGQPEHSVAQHDVKKEKRRTVFIAAGVLAVIAAGAGIFLTVSQNRQGQENSKMLLSQAETGKKQKENLVVEPETEEKAETEKIAASMTNQTLQQEMTGQTEAEPESETMTEPETMAESETDSMISSENATEQMPESETEEYTETETEFETVAEPEIEPESEAVTKSETGSMTEPETEDITENIAENTTEQTEPETQKVQETEQETESETASPKTWDGLLTVGIDGKNEQLGITVDPNLVFDRLEIFLVDASGEEISIYESDVNSMYAGTEIPVMDAGKPYNLRLTDETGNSVYGCFNMDLADYETIDLHSDNGYMYISYVTRAGEQVEEKAYELKMYPESISRYSLASLNIRRKPDTVNGEAASQYTLGDEITVWGEAKGLAGGESGDWYLVKYAQGYGFISAKDTYSTGDKAQADEAVAAAQRAAQEAAAAQQSSGGGYSGGSSSGGGSSKGKSSGGGKVVWDNGGVEWD